MFCSRVLVFVLFLAIVDNSRSSEVHRSVHEHALLNSEVFNKKLLPNVKHLLKGNSDGNRQKFLHLLSSLEIDGYKFVNDAPFTIIIPKITFDVATVDKANLQQFVFDHIIPGVQVKALKNGDFYGNMNQNPVEIKSLSPGRVTVNDIHVLNFNSVSAQLLSFVDIDGYLTDRKINFAKRNIQEHNSYNEPEKLVQKEASKVEVKESKDNKESKSGLLQSYLATMKSGTKVFQHFLNTSKLSQMLDADPSSNYIILVPSDSAFQRWHPIDWGFYPFSVPEFTESIMQNHVIQQTNPLIFKNIDKEVKMKAMGGEVVTFKNIPLPSVNNVTILSNATLPNGNDVYVISEVLFMSDANVSILHQQNKDKETPPLLAYPWFGAQFLSHAFLALERDNRFTQITKFFNAEIASSIVGSNYTFFVPFDDAFEKYGFDELPEDNLNSNRSVKMILNHFVKGRLYNRDLKHGEVFETVGGRPLKISRDTSGHVSVNQAKIVESEVFVYNLGTMFYIDDILYPEVMQNDFKPITQAPDQDKEKEESESSEEFYTTEIPISNEKDEKMTTKSNREHTTPEYKSILSALLTTRSDVELVPSQFTEFLEDAETSEFFVTPKALPLRYVASPPKRK